MPRWWNGRHAGLRSQCLVRESSSLSWGTKIMKLYEATIREPGPGTEERKVRIGAESAEEARRLLQQLYGPRSVPYLPRVVPS